MRQPFTPARGAQQHEGRRPGPTGDRGSVMRPLGPPQRPPTMAARRSACRSRLPPGNGIECAALRIRRTGPTMKFLFDLLPVILSSPPTRSAPTRGSLACAAAGWHGHCRDSLSAISQSRPSSPSSPPSCRSRGCRRRCKLDTMLWIPYWRSSSYSAARPLLHSPPSSSGSRPLYWLFGVSVLPRLGLICSGHQPHHTMLEAQIKLPDPVWARLNLAWAGPFITRWACSTFGSPQLQQKKPGSTSRCSAAWG